MNVVEEYVKFLVNKEYDAVNETHKPIASMHEGYAVLLEEVEETQEVCDQLKEYLEFLWREVRGDQPEYAKYNVNAILGIAVETACEAIQVAAVCKRITDYLSKEKNNAKT